jgi:N12 class adenine-specific DNA methylase
VRGDGDGAGTFGRVIDDVEEAYNRQFRGVVLVDHDPEPLHIRRWRGPQARQLRAHQVSAVWRLRENNYSGVAAFDVGVGKTYMLLALLALARQEGRVRRPVVVVPNGIAWKWFTDFRARSRSAGSVRKSKLLKSTPDQEAGA